MKFGKWTAIVGMAAIGALALGVGVACGGDDGGGGSKAETPEEYVATVCEKFSERSQDIEALMGDSADLEDPTQMKEAIEKAQPVIEDMAKDLDKIEPPAEIKEWHESMVSALDAAAEVFGKLKDVLDKPLEEAIAEMEDLGSELEGIEDPFTLSDLPDEYREAFDNDAKCQELDIFSE